MVSSTPNVCRMTWFLHLAHPTHSSGSTMWEDWRPATCKSLCKQPLVFSRDLPQGSGWSRWIVRERVQLQTGDGMVNPTIRWIRLRTLQAEQPVDQFQLLSHKTWGQCDGRGTNTPCRRSRTKRKTARTCKSLWFSAAMSVTWRSSWLWVQGQVELSEAYCWQRTRRQTSK